MDKHELLKLLKENKEKAFRYILSEYKERIYWHVRKMVLEHEDANDLTQETFIKVWKNLETFKGDSKIYTWIYRIATNLCLTHLEKKKRQQTTELEPDIHLSGTFMHSSGLETVTSEVIITKLLAALKTVPAKQRLVFNLRYFDNLKFKEIAELTDSSIGSLKASYHLAAKKIEEFLNSH